MTQADAAEVAGLGDVGDVAAWHLAEGEKAGREVGRPREMAGGVGVDHPRAGFPDGGAEFSLQRFTTAADI